jgi:transposase
MVHEHRSQYQSLWAAIGSIAPKIGCAPQTLNEWIRRSASSDGAVEGMGVPEQDRLKALERENKELHRANEILKLASAFFCPGGHRAFCRQQRREL